MKVFIENQNNYMPDEKIFARKLCVRLGHVHGPHDQDQQADAWKPCGYADISGGHLPSGPLAGGPFGEIKLSNQTRCSNSKIDNKLLVRLDK